MRFLSRLLLGEMPCWDGISPKKGKHGQGHLMHAIGVSVVRASSPYAKMEERGKTKQRILFGNKE